MEYLLMGVHQPWHGVQAAAADDPDLSLLHACSRRCTEPVIIQNGEGGLIRGGDGRLPDCVRELLYRTLIKTLQDQDFAAANFYRDQSFVRHPAGGRSITYPWRNSLRELVALQQGIPILLCKPGGGLWARPPREIEQRQRVRCRCNRLLVLCRAPTRRQVATERGKMRSTSPLP